MVAQGNILYPLRHTGPQYMPGQIHMGPHDPHGLRAQLTRIFQYLHRNSYFPQVMEYGAAGHIPDLIVAVQDTDRQFLADDRGGDGMGHCMGASEVNNIGQHPQKRLALIL